MSKRLRRRLFVDREVQGDLIGHMVRYWILSVATAGGLTLLGWMFISPGLEGFVGPEAFMAQVLPMVLVGIAAAAVVLPFLLFDLVRVSHRFAGPLIRLRRHMRSAADGAPLEPLRFRKDDYWHDLAAAYCDLLKRFEAEQKLEAHVASKLGMTRSMLPEEPAEAVSVDEGDAPHESTEESHAAEVAVGSGY